MAWTSGGGELLEGPGADGGSDVVAQQRGVAGHGAGASVGADVGQPAVQVLVDGEFGGVKEEAVAAAGQCVGRGGLGLGVGGWPPRASKRRARRRGRGAARVGGSSGCTGLSICRLFWGGL